MFLFSQAYFQVDPLSKSKYDVKSFLYILCSFVLPQLFKEWTYHIEMCAKTKLFFIYILRVKNVISSM